MAKRGKSASKTAKPALVRQPNGKGALYNGGVPGNRGNRHALGPPASVIRDRCRGSFSQRVPILEQIADGDPIQKMRLPNGEETESTVSASPADRLKAVDLLGKYGLDSRTQMGIPEIQDKLRRTVGIIREELGPDVAERIINRIKGEWAA